MKEVKAHGLDLAKEWVGSTNRKIRGAILSDDSDSGLHYTNHQRTRADNNPSIAATLTIKSIESMFNLHV
jgi:hypothetical protein